MTRVIIIGARGKRDCCMCRVLSRSDGRIITGWGGAAVVTGQLKNKNLLSWQTHFGRKVGQVF